MTAGPGRTTCCCHIRRPRCSCAIPTTTPGGSGKTICGASEALCAAIAYPGFQPGRTIIARYTYRQLEKTSWDTFRKIVPTPMIADERRSQHELFLKLKNGWEFYGWNLRNF